MNKKTTIILSVTVAAMVCIAVLLAILIPLFSGPESNYGTPENPAYGAISIPNYNNSLLKPKGYIYKAEESETDTFNEPNFFVRDNVLSYSVVGSQPLNDMGFTDISELFSISLNENNFDKLFIDEGNWDEGFDAKTLRTTACAASRADITAGDTGAYIPTGNVYFYLIATKDTIYICHIDNGKMISVTEMTIINEKSDPSFNTVDTDPTTAVEPA